jgi:hypothetical protein
VAAYRRLNVGSTAADHAPNGHALDRIARTPAIPTAQRNDGPLGSPRRPTASIWASRCLPAGLPALQFLAGCEEFEPSLYSSVSRV